MGKVTRAVLYTRVSTDEQAEHGTSLASQLEACLKMAGQLGAQVVHHFEDAGISGARYESRPGIQAAVAHIERGDSDCLIVYSISRLSRDREHQSVILKRVERAGGRIVFCDMNVDDTPEGRLMVNITGDFAEYERQLMRKRTTIGRRRRAAEGLQPCRSQYMNPFGYTIPTKKDVLHGLSTLDQVGKYQVIEEEALWVRGIFTRYAAGDSLRVLCRWLNDSGVKTPRNGQYWRVSTIKRIIENPVYMGKACFGRHSRTHDETLIAQGYKQPFRLRVRPQEEWLHIDAPALVDEVTWQRCNERIQNARANCSGRADRHHLLSGLLACPICGRNMSAQRRERRRNSGPYIEHNYHCRDARPSRNTGGVVCCSKHYPANIAEAAVLNAVRAFAHRPELVGSILRAYRDERRIADMEAERRRLRTDLSQLEGKERATVAAQIRGIQAGADPALYDRVFTEISEERNRLSARLTEIDRDIESLPRAEDDDDIGRLVSQAFADIEEALTAPEITVTERNALLRRVVEKVLPEGEGFQVRVRPFSHKGVTVANVRILCPPAAATSTALFTWARPLTVAHPIGIEAATCCHESPTSTTMPNESASRAFRNASTRPGFACFFCLPAGMMWANKP